ncbi:hypothetical protein [Deinococcus petrolearius]|uniref:Lipoprotein n=1 Tax=Deinococcus petrolearius TaxID=1751295 RepID=A0ABW1DKP0_9DEIO
MTHHFVRRFRARRCFQVRPWAGAGLLLGSTLLGACAPRAAAPAPVGASTPVSSVSFYPQEAGLNWTYLAEGETPGQPAYTLRALGPTVFQNQPVLASQLTGRGADQTWYRTSGADGVQLLGFRKPGVTVTLSPAWREAPPENAWRVGLSWEGSSRITVVSDDGREQARGLLRYRYDVQDRREVRTPAGAFTVYVVTRQISDDVGGLFPATQQYWFAPYVGEVRTPEGLLLTGRNFAPRGGGR